MLPGLVFAIAVVCSAAYAGPWRADMDDVGGMWGILHQGELLPVRAHFTVAADGWDTRLGPWQAPDLKLEQNENGRTWTGTVPLGDQPAARYRQRVDESGPDVTVELSLQALVDLELDGIYFDVLVPAARFEAGTCVLLGGGGVPTEHALPAPDSRQGVVQGTASGVDFRSADGYDLALELNQPRPVRVTASPGWLLPHYRVLVTVHAGVLRAGQEVGMQLRYRVRGEADRTAARLKLQSRRELYRFQGFGGNYCYWPRTPTVDHTLENLRPVWARTQMALDFWEPRNDNDDPHEIRWPTFEGAEKRQWILQVEMEAARKMARRGIPFIISCWRVPDWMRVPSSQAGRGNRRPVAREQWPEVIESIAAYLLYLRDNYEAEPAMFSFNEPMLGRMPQPQHHRDFSKLLGARLAQLGLKTNILAGDVANPRAERIDHARPLLEDPEARRHVAGLSFHSWGGADAATYRAWSELARTHRLPLFVAETGWNASAHHRRGAVHTLCYAVQELKLYQELLLHAQPQVVLEWEYGGSYPLLVEQDGQLVPTARYRFIEQLATMTPRPAVAIGTASGNDRVLFTAYRGAEADGREVYALHVANLGAGRHAVLDGLPPGTSSLRANCVVLAEDGARTQALRRTGDQVQLHLPALSLTTIRAEVSTALSQAGH